MHTKHFWNNLQQVGSKAKDWKAKDFGSDETKGSKQYSQNRLWSPMPLILTKNLYV